MKKVLLIKLEMYNIYSSAGMEEAFKEAFGEVRSIDWQREKLQGGVNGNERLWETIIRECRMFEPDLIFCQFQNTSVLNVEQFQRLSEYGFVINYTEDVREDISWYEEIAPHIGLTIFTNMDDCRKFWAKGLQAAYMMVSYNHTWYKPQFKTVRDYGDIIFTGTNYELANFNLNFPLAKERQEMIAFMKDRFGDKFQAYGMGQDNQRLDAMQCVEAYNNAKIVITHNNFIREGYCSDRGLNSMGCGAVTIHREFENIRELLKFDPFVYTWDNLGDLWYTCHEILKSGVNDSNKSAIAGAAYTNHSWHNRIKFVKGFIKLQMDKVNYLKDVHI